MVIGTTQVGVLEEMNVPYSRVACAINRGVSDNFDMGSVQQVGRFLKLFSEDDEI